MIKTFKEDQVLNKKRKYEWEAVGVIIFSVTVSSTFTFNSSIVSESVFLVALSMFYHLHHRLSAPWLSMCLRLSFTSFVNLCDKYSAATFARHNNTTY